jgi:hypothetical protein
MVSSIDGFQIWYTIGRWWKYGLWSQLQKVCLCRCVIAGDALVLASFCYCSVLPGCNAWQLWSVMIPCLTRPRNNRANQPWTETISQTKPFLLLNFSLRSQWRSLTTTSLLAYFDYDNKYLLSVSPTECLPVTVSFNPALPWNKDIHFPARETEAHTVTSHHGPNIC